MELTPLGRSLVEPVSDLLVRIDATLGTRPGFDPATTRRRFRIVASDYVVEVVMADVLQRVHRLAPGVHIELVAPSDDAAAALEGGDLDLMVMPALFASTAHAHTPLFDDCFVLLADRAHPQVGASVSLAQYVALRHVGFDNAGKAFFERWFERTHGDVRRVEASAYGFGMLPRLLPGTEWVATVPWRLAQRLLGWLPLRAARLDFEVPQLQEVLQWHSLREMDPGAQWLREQTLAQAAALPPLPE
jgi:DNA-binding transcriptional LysR family regulator